MRTLMGRIEGIYRPLVLLLIFLSDTAPMEHNVSPNSYGDAAAYC